MTTCLGPSNELEFCLQFPWVWVYSSPMPYKDPEEAKVKAKAYREANKERLRVYVKANKESMASDHVADREANRDTLNAKSRDWYQANKEANREKRKARHRAWYQANKEKMASYNATYREANREKQKARHKQYRKIMKFRLSAKKKFGSLVNLIKLTEASKILKNCLHPKPEISK